jgi:ferredoxin
VAKGVEREPEGRKTIWRHGSLWEKRGLGLKKRLQSGGWKRIFPTQRNGLKTKTNNKIMADAANKYSDNAAGKFYVDDQCIDCDLCRETAPENFKRNDDGGLSYVYKQPETPDEEARCEEAMGGCPVEAIGNDA